MKYSEGYLFDDRYVLERFIGSGAYGEVWVAIDKATDIEVAIKVYASMDEKGLQEFKDEFKITFELSHSNLLHANYLGVNTEDKRPYLVMPYCPDGSVTKYAGQMQENEIWRFIRDVAAGLAYLHSKNPPIIHQDIKPDNILILKSGDFVITDFGISKQLRATMRKTAGSVSSAGSISYMGPERFTKQYHAVKASDIWSLGASIFELATNELPFCGMGGSLLKQGADMPELPEEYSETLNAICQACMAKEPWNRPTAQQLSDYAARILEGETSPRMPWVKDESQQPETPAVAPQPEKSNPMTATVPFASPAPQAAPVPQAAPAPQVVPAAPEAPVMPANDGGVPVYAGYAGKNDSLPAWVWVVSAVAGLAVGVILNLFM